MKKSLYLMGILTVLFTAVVGTASAMEQSSSVIPANPFTHVSDRNLYDRLAKTRARLDKEDMARAAKTPMLSTTSKKYIWIALITALVALKTYRLYKWYQDRQKQKAEKLLNQPATAKNNGKN